MPSPAAGADELCYHRLLAAPGCGVRAAMGKVWDEGQRIQLSGVGRAQEAADPAGMLRHAAPLPSSLLLSFGLPPAPCPRFCATGWQRICLLPGCGPRQ